MLPRYTERNADRFERLQGGYIVTHLATLCSCMARGLLLSSITRCRTQELCHRLCPVNRLVTGRSEAHRSIASLQRATMKLIDIGANLLDEMYQGHYNGKQYHPPDLPAVLDRAWASGVERIIITAGSLTEARAALALARTDDRLFCTVGCHPTRCGELDAHPGGPEAYLSDLQQVLDEGLVARKVVAVGECGLDYDRLHFCDEATQRRGFELQFRLAKASSLPMFLHLRAASAVLDFLDLIKRHEEDFVSGVVHSFDGSLNELQQVLAVDKLCIGLNGCSLKTEANLSMVAAIPAERLMLETDSPWCEMRNTHAGRRHVVTPSFETCDRKKHDPTRAVKNRNEPYTMRQILEAVAGARNEQQQLEQLADQVWRTTSMMFFNRPLTPPPL